VTSAATRSRRPTHANLGAVLLAVTAAAAAGCANSKPGPRAGVRKPEPRILAIPQETAAKYADPLEVSQLREKALDLLIAMASDPQPQIRGNALEAMLVTPQRLESLVASALRDENVGVRTIAATLIGKASFKNLTAAVRPLLNDPSPYVQASAIFALAKCGVEVDQTPLGRILMTDPSPRVRSHVAVLLGDLGDRSALGLLNDASRQAIPRASAVEIRMMQIQIAEAMVKIGDEDQLGVIRSALYPSRPEDLEITALAVQVLGQLRDRGSTDELIYLSARRDEAKQYWPAEIRLGVAGALARIGLNKGTFLADEYAPSDMPVLRAQAAYVYGQIGLTENLGKLEALMADPVPLVRLSAAAAILQIGSKPASARASLP